MFSTVSCWAGAGGGVCCASRLYCFSELSRRFEMSGGWAWLPLALRGCLVVGSGVCGGVLVLQLRGLVRLCGCCLLARCWLGSEELCILRLVRLVLSGGWSRHGALGSTASDSLC